jgi:hypothetical protein
MRCPRRGHLGEPCDLTTKWNGTPPLLQHTGKKVSYEGMNPHTQASLLKSFLKELADPVFTAKLYPGWIAGASSIIAVCSLWSSSLINLLWRDGDGGCKQRRSTRTGRY